MPKTWTGGEPETVPHFFGPPQAPATMPLSDIEQELIMLAAKNRQSPLGALQRDRQWELGVEQLRRAYG